MESFSLEQFSYLADVVGMIAVVASLIYVGKQIRQNTETMQVNAAGAQAKWASESIAQVTHNRELAEWWLKGSKDFDALDEIDKERLLYHEISVINMWNYFFLLREHNLMPEERWHYQIWGFNNFGKRKSVQEAWKIVKSAYEKSFQDFASQYFE